jgi:hypothetical protein
LIGTQANGPAVVEAMKKRTYPLKLPDSIKAAAAELARDGYNSMRSTLRAFTAMSEHLIAVSVRAGESQIIADMGNSTDRPPTAP